tara:strand:- start:278 stop:658 length:381 start_codon:yes stop_codon:yes gene_type:complete
MKINEFKKILKPLIEQTVREVLLQEGVLSRVVSEVARGMSTPVLESKQRAKVDESEQERLYEEKRQEKIRKLNEGIGMDVFNNVKQISEGAPGSALGSVAPSDPGVDISGIQRLAGSKWKALAGGK